NRVLGLLERGGAGRITVDKIDVGNVVKIDGGLAFIVADSDVEPLSGDTLTTVTDVAVEALTKVIAETKEVRDARLMLGNAAWAGAATLIFAVVLVILRFAGRAVSRRMLRIADAAAEKMKIGGTAVLNRHSVIRFARLVVRIAFYTFALLFTYEWLGFVLGRFPFTRAWGEHLNTFLRDTTFNLLSGIAQALPELLIVVVI